MNLEQQSVLRLFDAGGPLQGALSSFEPRGEQQRMALDVAGAFAEAKISLIEAGTGTGKSLAYLLPALLWILDKGERLVISTKTIQLQEQLQNKEIPLARRILGRDFQSAIVKGMGNYLCLKRLREAEAERALLTEKEACELDRLSAWSAGTGSGSKAELSEPPSPEGWERVRAESEACLKRRCPFYEECFFFRERQLANQAQVLIANHHLLSADLAYRSLLNNYEEPLLLPSYQRVVVDEAHHLEEVATQFFAKRLGYFEFLRPLARLASEKREADFGQLFRLEEKLAQTAGKEEPELWTKLKALFRIDLPSCRKALLQKLGGFFDALLHCFYTFLPPGNQEGPEKKLRLTREGEGRPFWIQEVLPLGRELLGEARRYLSLIGQIEEELVSCSREELFKRAEGERFDVSASGALLEEACRTLEGFLQPQGEGSEGVRWIETALFNKMPTALLKEAPLSISEELASSLFERFETVVLSSATLSVRESFGFIRERLGLNLPRLEKRRIEEAAYPSPFDYREQALLLVPEDLPEPQSPAFFSLAVKALKEALLASRGNAFALFTSFSSMRSCFAELAEPLRRAGLRPMMQGQEQRSRLLERFKRGGRAVLFGTDSFWEGVDVLGEALRNVVIFKLPFQAPDEPVVQARMEAIASRGGNPFFEYALPHAIVKFKQGFGRLIRHKEDRGCIVCLDSRLIKRPYGKLFLKSLPPCGYLPVKLSEMGGEMVRFYKGRRAS